MDDTWAGEDLRQYTEDGPITGQVREFFPDGLISGISTYYEGVLDGLQRSYHRNGQPEEEGVMEMDHRVGIWREWYANGQLKSEAQWEAKSYLPITKRTWTEDGTETT